MLFLGLSPPRNVEVVSDASGSLGFRAYLNGAWFSGSWVVLQKSQSIAYNELFPVVLAARFWGAQWPRQHILLSCDNEAVVHILNTRTSKVPALMHLLRDLLLSATRFSFSFSTEHVPKGHNKIADALSRFGWQDFWCLVPHTNPQPTPLQQLLLDQLTTPLFRDDAGANPIRQLSYVSKLVNVRQIALCALLMNGLCVFLLPSWRILSGLLPSRSTCQLCDHFT